MLRKSRERNLSFLSTFFPPKSRWGKRKMSDTWFYMCCSDWKLEVSSTGREDAWGWWCHANTSELPANAAATTDLLRADHHLAKAKTFFNDCVRLLLDYFFPKKILLTLDHHLKDGLKCLRTLKKKKILKTVKNPVLRSAYGHH